jgi:phosphopantetheine binding protein/AMP-binding enzyme
LLGRAFADRRAYVLGEEQELLPVGVVGELFVSGGGVARGYLKQPALTAEKFLPDPFSATPGTRLYRTGDLARYLPNGEIEFIGRGDEQIKLRGYRIELGEIEAVLAAHQSVRQAVVIHSESERLVGFVVLENAGTVSGQQLRQYVGEQLPEYMVPAVVVELEQLPVTSNGKIDRRALAVTAAEVKAEAEAEYVAPRTKVETAVAEIWAEMLGVKRVGVTDNFFELGGHSLLAGRVQSRIRKTMGVELPLRMLFERPNVAAIAEVLAERTVTGGWSEVERIKRRSEPEIISEYEQLTEAQVNLMLRDYIDEAQVNESLLE